MQTSYFTERYLFSGFEKVILMSATFLSKKEVCSELGIDPVNTTWISCDSPFPTENHKFFLTSAGSLNYKQIDATLPKLMAIIRKIMSFHPDDKGIIHCIDEDTLILTKSGKEKKIRDLEIGDEIVSFNVQYNKFEFKLILNKFDNGERECFELNFDNGSSIKCTAEHKFYTKNRGWVPAIDLNNEDEVVSFCYE